MTVIISFLRGINVGGHALIKMDALRRIYEALGLQDVQTHLQSGNVVFKAAARDLPRLPGRIEEALERAAGFRPTVIHRTASELKDVIARNPFASRRDIEPNKFLVGFLAADPSAEAREKLLALKTAPEEVRIDGRELYVYYPSGMGRPKIPMALIEKTLKTAVTGRNWNTVRKLLEIAERSG